TLLPTACTAGGDGLFHPGQGQYLQGGGEDGREAARQALLAGVGWRRPGDLGLFADVVFDLERQVAEAGLVERVEAIPTRHHDRRLFAGRAADEDRAGLGAVGLVQSNLL